MKQEMHKFFTLCPVALPFPVLVFSKNFPDKAVSTDELYLQPAEGWLCYPCSVLGLHSGSTALPLPAYLAFTLHSTTSGGQEGKNVTPKAAAQLDKLGAAQGTACGGETALSQGFGTLAH